MTAEAPEPTAAVPEAGGRDRFAPLRRRVAQLILLGLRLANAAAKFALAVYMARYLGLEEVGVYGLLVGATTAIPAILGFGLDDWISRRIVGVPRAEAIRLATTRHLVTIAAEVALQAAVWGVLLGGGLPVAPRTAVLISAILLLEHLAVGDYAIEIGRERPTFANLQLFLRAGAWPLPVIAWGLADPAARTLDVVLGGWLAGLLVMWAMVAVRSLGGGRWRHLGLDRDFLRIALPAGFPFWLATVGAVGNLYLDRFVVSLFLGMEATGVYTFFWSFANVVHTLAVNGIVQPQVPRLIAAERTGDPARFAAERGALARDSLAWAAVLVVGIGVALPLILPWLGRPPLVDNLAIFYVVLLATTARIASDGYGFLLYALNRDHAIAATALGGLAATGLFGITLIPAFGLAGAAIAYLLVGLGLLLARRRIVAAEIGRRAAARGPGQ